MVFFVVVFLRCVLDVVDGEMTSSAYKNNSRAFHQQDFSFIDKCFPRRGCK